MSYPSFDPLRNVDLMEFFGLLKEKPDGPLGTCRICEVPHVRCSRQDWRPL